MTQPRQIQYQDVFFPVLPVVTVVTDPGAAAWQGSNERPWQFQQPVGALNYLRPSVFWTPITDLDQGITLAAFQGSNERHLSMRLGPPNVRNVDKPSVFQTFVGDRERGITFAAFQGSNVRPNPRPTDQNVLREWTFMEPMMLRTLAPFGIGVLRVFFTLRQVLMSFGVACNWQMEGGTSSVFTPDMAAAAAWAGDPAQNVVWAYDPPAGGSWGGDPGGGGTWTPQNPYCKPGQP